MKLVNITSFENFKILNEDYSEFSNKTGFRESLVGRATFGILRYFKKGINLGKLEYYKRKLENEYFAAILRFCAHYQINLKTGEYPQDLNLTQNENDGEQNDNDNDVNLNTYQPEYCEILNNDSDKNAIDRKKRDTENLLRSLNTVIPTLTDDDDIDEANKLKDNATNIINLCIFKNKMIDNILSLSGKTNSVDPDVVTILDEIENFLSSDLCKLCPTYKGTDKEKNVILHFLNSNDAAIKAKAEKVKPLLENYYYNFNLINEDITSGINKSISIEQMLGDQLNTSGKVQKVDIYKYLKDIQIDSVEDINFPAILKSFRENPKWRDILSTDQFTNYASIRKIQYSVSDGIIFHVSQTPDNIGINPAKGGGVTWSEDTSMRKVWEKKVEYVKSEFAGFFNFKTVDPFVLLNLSDAMRQRDRMYNDNDVSTDRGVVKNLSTNLILETNASKLGLIAKGNESVDNERDLFVFSLISGSYNYYPVFSIKKINNIKLYKYIGCINFDKITNNNVFNNSDFKNIAKDYSNAVWDSVKTNSDKNFLNFLKLPDIITSSNPSHYFDAIYFSSSDFEYIKSNKSTSNNKNVRFLYNFLKPSISSGDYKGPNRGNPNRSDILLKLYTTSGIQEIPEANYDNIKNYTKDKMFGMKTGEIYQIEDDWVKSYFPDTKEDVLKYKDYSFINDNKYNGKLILK